MLLEGKTALVTGCSRGMGTSIALEYARNGAVVYANARQEGSLEELAQQAAQQSFPGRILPVYFDVADRTGMKNCIMRIKKEAGQLDVLVNNAGVMKDAIIGMISDDDLKATFEVNVFAVIHLIQYAAKLMVPKGSGSIINLASVVALRGNRGHMAYSASKGAVIALTKTASCELSPKGIRVNAIAPGIIDTDMYRSAPASAQAQLLAQVGMGRVGTPEEVADTCVFLGSDLSRYISGQVIGVDGGYL